MTRGAFSRLLQREEDLTRQAPIQGLYFAEVDHLEDEGYILNWLSGNVTEPSAPARVATLMAGSERGSFFMPEPGDEVVVGFEEGNLDKPVILGALWSEQDEPPVQADTSDTNNVRTLVSRSGHEITFDDGANQIIIKTKGGIQIVLSDDTDITITASGKPINVTCDKLTVTGNVEINGDLKVVGPGGAASTTISGHEITGA